METILNKESRAAIELMVADGMITQEVAIKYFPELKESEDERIREWIRKELESKYVVDNIVNNEMADKALAWLKKQGNKVSAIEGFETEFERQVSGLIASAINKEHEYNQGYVKWTANALLNYAKRELEKQGEQKPVDKVESKFKIGDWVVVDGVTQQVTQIRPDGFDTDRAWNGKLTFKDVHLWTIQDAKDGDILSDRYSIVIFRGIGNEKWNDVIDYHIGLFTNSQHLVVQKSLSHWGRINEVTLHPATKEQRDTLMKAMADAGYTFDFEKKELKKIEQKPAWSEEDKAMLDSAIAFVEHSAFTTIGKGKGGVVAWLKSLKERVQPQPKQEWSALDERNLQGVIDEIQANKNNAPDYDLATYDRFLSWLESLKERYTWKPSDEQMEALDDFIYAKYPNIEKYEASVKSLYQDLKKLRGE